MKTKTLFRVLSLICVFILAVGSLSACGENTKEDATTSETQELEPEEEAADPEPSVSAEPEETIVPEDADEEEVLEETEGGESSGEPQNVDEWAMSFAEGEGLVSIWNENTKEGIVIEEEGGYIWHEGDQLVIRSGMYTISRSIQVEYIASNIYYSCATVLETFTKPTVVNIGIENEEGYSVRFWLISEEYFTEDSFDGYYVSNTPGSPESADTSEVDVTELTEGESWVTSLDYDEPKLVFWNDELGIQTVVEEGESYQMNAGDVMAMYLPEGCYLSVATVNYANMVLESKDGYSIIDYSTLGQNTNVELQLVVVAADAGMIFPIYYITTP